MTESLFDPYRALDLSYGVTEAEIKSQYRKLVKMYHPDRNKDPNASERLNEVIRGYQILSDPIKKNEFDRQREEQIFGQYRPKNTDNIFQGVRNFAAKVVTEFLEEYAQDDDEFDPEVLNICSVRTRQTNRSLRITVEIPAQNLDDFGDDSDYWLTQLSILIEREIKNRI